jgi:hypothetical protein
VVPDFNFKGFGSNATGILSGLAAGATAIAAIIGVLTQFGFIGNHDRDKAAAVASASADVNDAGESLLHHKHKHHKVEPDELIASAPSPTTPSQAADAAAPSTAGSGAAAPQQAAAPRSAVAMAEPLKPALLAGAWRDANIGACHLIRQNGASFTTTNFGPESGRVIGRGTGTIDGNNVEIDYPRHHMKLELHVEPDGKTMRGAAIRENGVFKALWIYVGTDCSKAG